MLGGNWQHHHHGQLLVGHEAVAFENLEFVFINDHAFAWDYGAQTLNDIPTPGDHALIGCGHLH